MSKARMHLLSPLVIFVVVFAVSSSGTGALDANRQVYIVYMGALPDGQYSAQSHHHRILEQVLDGSFGAADALVYSYGRSFNGFAAKLTHQEQQRIAGMEGVVSVFPSRNHNLHTTRSWDFTGFPETVQRNPTVEGDVIVGMIDTGVWPVSESFSYEGFGPPPKKWKGTCQTEGYFTCNNKLIGARFYPINPLIPNTNDSAIDTEGHGTHTASTAAGRKVDGVSFFGLAGGNARGAVPSARIAVYKVCWPGSCSSQSILAAFDDAIADGVDIISVSLAAETQLAYYEDAIAIGSFHAMRKGILVSQSAGNGGPDYGTLSSGAPWLLTVAAATTDRRIVDNLTLGDGTTYLGNAINTFNSIEKMAPLVYGRDASPGCNEIEARTCSVGCLDKKVVKGTIVLCDGLNTGSGPVLTGAVGMIAQDDIESDFALVYALPSSLINSENGLKVRSYINATKKPQATITKSEAIHNSKAPLVASFSSRGPNLISKDILKPDISAPGAEILAAYSPLGKPSGWSEDKRSVQYSIMSGTSMACPHVSGAAAYVKSFHPDWSPASIKSALLTTATQMDSNKKEFDYGAGFLNPVKAVNPGLVYDAQEDDYLQMLCNEGYNTTVIQLIAGHKFTCPKTPRATKDLNQPSMTVYFDLTGKFKANFTRIVTNVGSTNATYKVAVNTNPQIEVTVSPNVLEFKATGKKQTFVVTVSGTLNKSNDSFVSFVTSSLVWSDGIHSVRSPIVVYSISKL